MIIISPLRYESSNKGQSMEPPICDIENVRAAIHIGNNIQAVEFSNQLLGRFPGSFVINCCMGEALANLCLYDQAVDAYRRAVVVNPRCGRTLGRLAFILYKAERLEESAKMFDDAIGLDPRNYLTLSSMALVLLKLKRFPQAELVFRKALEIKPGCMDNIAGLADCIVRQGRLGEAWQIFIENYSRSVENINLNMGFATLLQMKGFCKESSQIYNKILSSSPDNVDAIFNNSMNYLHSGNFSEGWKLYECRKRLSEPHGILDHPAREWDGSENLAEKSLLLYSEQGLGDTIQFVRYVSMIENQCSQITLLVQESVRALISSSMPHVEVISENPKYRHFDFRAALMSLPLAFRTVPKTIPAPIPYLRADRARLLRWADRLGWEGFRIGICWHGNNYNVNDQRSIPLAEFGTLADIPGVRLISLQKESDQTVEVPGFNLERFDGSFDRAGETFLDTAAVMCHCNLIITCDTSVAHVAGALGVPVWVVLPKVAEWRWMLGVQDTPWYPSMRLFRQDAWGDWATPFRDVRHAVLEYLSREYVG